MTGLSSSTLIFQAVWERHSLIPPPPPEGLVAHENPLNLGDVPQDVLKGCFELVNQAKNPVRMIQIVPSCRCTAITVPSEEVVPGETVYIAFEWDTTGVRGVQGSRFTLFYSEEEHNGLRSLELYVKGNILPKFDFVPEKLEFTEGKTETKTIKLVPRDDHANIIIENVSYALAAFKVEKLADREIAVTFQPHEWIDDPARIQYVAVKTNYEREQQCAIFISVQKQTQ